MRLSALNSSGLNELWEKVMRFQQLQTDGGRWLQRRQTQALTWMNERIQSGLKDAFTQHAGVAAALSHMQQEVLAGRIAASTAARQLLALASRPDT